MSFLVSRADISFKKVHFLESRRGKSTPNSFQLVVHGFLAVASDHD